MITYLLLFLILLLIFALLFIFISTQVITRTEKMECKFRQYLNYRDPRKGGGQGNEAKERQ